MSSPLHIPASRRAFLKAAGSAAAVSALAGIKIPFVHAAEDNAIEIALVGCGGRGTGAAANALSVSGPPLKLVAAADVSKRKLETSVQNLVNTHGGKVDVPAERQFVGFDGYKNAMDSLKPGGIVLLTTPPAFRWVHYKQAIDKGINVFMEKPVCTDGPTARRMLALNEQAKAKGIKVAVGLMCRHCKVRKELANRVHSGEIGDIVMLRAYRMQGPTASFRTKRMPETEKSELLYQIKNFHSFLWASGGAFSDFFIHNIDEACWMKNELPVSVRASGGRHFREDWVDQNFDSYSCEYTFADGAKLYFEGRNMTGCDGEFATYAHGTNGMAIVSTAGHLPAKSRIFRKQRIKSEDLRWSAPQPEPDPYQLEWDDFLAAIRSNTPYNEVQRGVEISLVTAMGRMSAHTGQTITYEQALAWEPEFAPDVDKLTLDGPSPLRADAEGKYPLPNPGVNKKSEYVVAKAG
jgi:predicted dehydrogenase